MRYIIIIFLSMLLIGCTEETKKKVIVCWGSSSTMPHKDYGIKGNIKKWLSGNFIDDSYPGFLETELKDNYKIINCGVGGENSLTIAARQGSIPMYLANDIILFPEVKERVIGNENIPILRSSWDNSIVQPLLQCRWQGGTAHINPCYINQIPMILKSENVTMPVDSQGRHLRYDYLLERIHDGDRYDTLKAGSIVLTEAALHLRAQYLNIFHVGNNGGYKNIQDFIMQLKQMINYSKCSRYIIISPHKTNSTLQTVKELKELEKELSQNFGKHYINLRDYMVKSGLKDAGLTAEAPDKDSIAHGQVPPQLMTDGTHFNAHANRLIATLVERKMKELGY